MRKRSKLVAGTMVLGSFLLTAQPADAAYGDISCANGSYSALIRVYYTPNTPQYAQALVTQVNYALYPANGSAKNNVGYSDGGTAPSRSASTGSALRDGSLHALTTGDYYRSGGSISMSADFDRSFQTDPHCSNSRYIYATS